MNPNVMMFSPPKAVMKESRGAGLGGVRGQAKESVPSLTCAKFSSGITLEFGSVQLNKSHTMRFSMLNPDQQKSVIIETDKGLESKGFSVVLGDDGGSSVTLAPNGKGGGVVTWTPRANMTVSKKLGLKLDGESRLQIKVCGIAGTGKVRTHHSLTHSPVVRPHAFIYHMRAHTQPSPRQQSHLAK